MFTSFGLLITSHLFKNFYNIFAKNATKFKFNKSHLVRAACLHFELCLHVYYTFKLL